MTRGNPADPAPEPAAAPDAAGEIERLLAVRGAGKTVCPSEIARALAGEGGDWRARMGEVHAAADALLCNGRVALSWKGRRLAAREGPYRIGPPA